MLYPNEVLHIVGYVLELCGGTFAVLVERPSMVQYVVYATVVIRLVVALAQLTSWVLRIMRHLLRGQRQRTNARRQNDAESGAPVRGPDYQSDDGRGAQRRPRPR